MMYKFEKRDEGFIVFTEEGRGVANIDCARIVIKDDPKLRHPESVVEKFEKDNWQIHFTSIRLTPSQLETFLEELDAQEF